MTAKQKQCLLTFLGYDTGGVDGIWGEKSTQAAKKFQAEFGLEADGVFGPGTEARILEAVGNGEARPAEKKGDFWASVPNFTRAEFRCPCPRCGGFPAEPAQMLVRAAQALRDQVGKPIHISSGVRCQPHNEEVGGVPNSRHLIGHAVDFRVEGKTSAEVLPLALAIPGIVYAYAIDDRYVHMDIGG